MGFLRYNAHLKTGTATGVAPGGTVTGNHVTIGGSKQRAESLSALVTVDAETDTITLAAKWQASNDTTTWVDVANGSQNAAAVVLATGTDGADASVTKVIPAPSCIEGFKYARLAIEVGVVTGTASDTFSIGYQYRQH